MRAIGSSHPPWIPMATLLMDIHSFSSEFEELGVFAVQWAPRARRAAAHHPGGSPAEARF